jgi:hypothetical protein
LRFGFGRERGKVKLRADKKEQVAVRAPFKLCHKLSVKLEPRPKHCQRIAGGGVAACNKTGASAS